MPRKGGLGCPRREQDKPRQIRRRRGVFEKGLCRHGQNLGTERIDRLVGSARERRRAIERNICLCVGKGHQARSKSARGRERQTRQDRTSHPAQRYKCCEKIIRCSIGALVRKKSITQPGGTDLGNPRWRRTRKTSGDTRLSILVKSTCSKAW